MMNSVIRSDRNETVRLVKKLQMKKHRDHEGLMVIEGRNLVSEALRKGIHTEAVLVADGIDTPKWIPRDIRILTVDRRLFEKMTDAQNGTGMLAIVRKPTPSLDVIREQIAQGGNIVILDRLQDPGNIGTIIRTAVAAGYSAVFTIKGTADVFSPKVLRSTAGMIFEMPIVTVGDNEELLSIIRSMNLRLTVTVPTGGRDYFDVDLRSNVALVIGNEGNGISDELIASSDERITIPMEGEIESLNASVSAAILMYERIRYQGKSFE